QGVRSQIERQAGNTNEIKQAVDAITITIEEKASSGSSINSLLKKQSNELIQFEKEIKISTESLLS
ncbi:MAG TPA: hypothetical protein VLS94_09385, partial [Fusibacter sp.]|nr:hypothetical protein [Fusibacter sp.]